MRLVLRAALVIGAAPYMIRSLQVDVGAMGGYGVVRPPRSWQSAHLGGLPLRVL